MRYWWIKDKEDWVLAIERMVEGESEIYFPHNDVVILSSMGRYIRNCPHIRVEGPAWHINSAVPVIDWWEGESENSDFLLEAWPESILEPHLIIEGPINRLPGNCRNSLEIWEARLELRTRENTEKPRVEFEVFIRFRTDLPSCPKCDKGVVDLGNGDTEYCKWCLGSNCSVLDEAKKIAARLYWAWFNENVIKIYAGGNE